MIAAVEDSIGEALIRKLLAVARPDLSIGAVVGLAGRGVLQRRARELNRAAAGIKVLILADLDTPAVCPPDLAVAWFGTRTPTALFRVAVMEAESWVLADRRAIASLLGVRSADIPPETDGIPDPKQFLVNLARRCRFRELRHELVPAPGSTAAVGPAYNPRVIEFVRDVWDPNAASGGSDSLRRALQRISAW